MNLACFPKLRYTEGRTPIDKLSRFSKRINGPDIYIKRDDLLGLTGGGNKTRKLEFLVADALAKGADTLITCGAIQSNHCRLTLAAAVKEGLKCRLVLTEVVPNSYKPDAGGNILLYKLLGVEKTELVPWGTDMYEVMNNIAEELKEEGRTGYIIPMGGSNQLGTLGYVACAEEIIAQADEEGNAFTHIIVAAGSGGTQGGLLLGLHGCNRDIPVMGMCVLNDRKTQERLVRGIVERTGEYLGIDGAGLSEKISCPDEYLGAGYTVPTAEMVEAVKLLAGTEGILLDPTYSGKAMAGLIDLVKQGYFQKDDQVLFIHTGGIPGLYAAPAIFSV
ncbi:MAG: D-cysteine desulfhydrase [Peptococcaceae bacterium]